MPDLPTLTVTQAQADRIVAAFGSVANYRTWLKEAVRDRVRNVEVEKIRAQSEADMKAKSDEVNQYLVL